MISEQLSPTIVKLTLTPKEAAELPPTRNREQLKKYIRRLAEDIRHEDSLSLPEGKLLAEIYIVSDGSCVIFISALEPHHSKKELYACEVSGIDILTKLMSALAASEAKCSVYCGREMQNYRIIFKSPPPQIKQICSEYGEYSEISALFAAQTAEYLTQIAEGCPANVLHNLLS